MGQIVQVPVVEFRTRLSEFFDIVKQGGTIIVTSHGSPVARLMPPEASMTTLPFGILTGKIRIAEGFDDPLPEMMEAIEQPL